MVAEVPRRRRVPTAVYVGGIVGGAAGAWAGNALCLGYDVLFGPWFPQAGVDPQPAGWVGWWMAGGAAVGACGGVLAALVLAALWPRAAGSPPRT